MSETQGGQTSVMYVVCLHTSVCSDGSLSRSTFTSVSRGVQTVRLASISSRRQFPLSRLPRVTEAEAPDECRRSANGKTCRHLDSPTWIFLPSIINSWQIWKPASLRMIPSWKQVLRRPSVSFAVFQQPVPSRTPAGSCRRSEDVQKLVVVA